MFWVDQIVEDVLKKNPKDHYVITDWKTPSGHVHVGALRGVLIHGAIARGLAEHDKKITWQYGFDDADPMDSLPVYLPKSFSEFMGKPLALIPSPKKSYRSFGEYFAEEFQAIFKSLGEDPKVVYTYELYKNGTFNEAIKIVLGHAQEIRRVYQAITHKKQPDDWLPIQVICEQCGRIGTTYAYAWDEHEVSYKCKKDWVKYTEGCGHEGKISPFNGNAKLPWRVEWPTKWFIFKSDIEGAGKDHQTKGGSHDMAVAISESVFKKQTPYNIPYEFFLVEGKKMSSSKGLGATAKLVSVTTPPELLRLLMIMTRPNRAINFSPEGDTIPRLYDEYDKAAQVYREDPKSDIGRMFHLSLVESKKPPAFHFRFNKVATLIQLPHIDIYKMAKEEKGSVLRGDEKLALDHRIKYAQKWLDIFGPEEFKLVIQKELPEVAKQLSRHQKKFLNRLADMVESGIKNFREAGSRSARQRPITGEELHAKIHELKQKMGLKPTEAFQAIYLAILGKPSGPQAGWFLAALDKKFVVERFRNIN